MCVPALLQAGSDCRCLEVIHSFDSLEKLAQRCWMWLPRLFSFTETLLSSSPSSVFTADLELQSSAMYRLDGCGLVGGGNKIGLDFPVSSAHSCLINIAATGRRHNNNNMKAGRFCVNRLLRPTGESRKQKVDVHVCCWLKIAAHRACKTVETSCKLPACVHCRVRAARCSYI